MERNVDGQVVPFPPREIVLECFIGAELTYLHDVAAHCSQTVSSGSTLNTGCGKL